MWEAVLVFDEHEFTCIDPITNQLLEKDYRFSYTEVVGVIMRARYEHADLRLFIPFPFHLTI